MHLLIYAIECQYISGEDCLNYNFLEIRILYIYFTLFPKIIQRVCINKRYSLYRLYEPDHGKRYKLVFLNIGGSYQPVRLVRRRKLAEHSKTHL